MKLFWLGFAVSVAVAQSLMVSPSGQQLTASQSLRFSAAGSIPPVAWSLARSLGAICPDGTYTAPPAIATDNVEFVQAKDSAGTIGIAIVVLRASTAPATTASCMPPATFVFAPPVNLVVAPAVDIAPPAPDVVPPWEVIGRHISPPFVYHGPDDDWPTDYWELDNLPDYPRSWPGWQMDFSGGAIWVNGVQADTLHDPRELHRTRRIYPIDWVVVWGDLRWREPGCQLDSRPRCLPLTGGPLVLRIMPLCDYTALGERGVPCLLGWPKDAEVHLEWDWPPSEN